MTAIPSIPKNADAETRRFLEAVKQILEIGTTDRAGTGESFVRTKDLVSGGIAKVNRVGTLSGVAVATATSVPQTPNTVSQLSATAVFTQVILDWVYPGPNDVEYFEVSRALGQQTIADAVVVGTTQAQVFADAGVNPGVSYKYWVRGVNNGKFGGYSDINGVSVTLDTDILTAIATVSGGVKEQNLSSTLIDSLGDLSGNTQEILDRSAAIAAEIVDRKAGDDANQTQIDTVVTDVATVNSDLTDEIANRVTEFTNVYGMLFTNNGEITSLNSSLADEVTARQTEIGNLNNTVAAQQSQITTNADDLVAETAARVAQISSLDSQIAGVLSTTTTLTSDLSAETSARTTAISGVNSTIASIQTDVSTNATDISAETAARDSAISTIDSTIASIETDVATNVAGLTAETTARESAISTVNNTIASIQTDLTTATDDISAEVSAREAQYATLNSALATVQTDVTTVATDLSAETTARTDQIASVNTSIATLTTDINTVASDLQSEVTTLETAIANVGTDTAAVQTIVNARVDPLEDVVEASYTLSVDANGVISGFQLINSSGQPSSFTIHADEFRINKGYIDYGTETSDPGALPDNGAKVVNTYNSNDGKTYVSWSSANGGELFFFGPTDNFTGVVENTQMAVTITFNAGSGYDTITLPLATVTEVLPANSSFAYLGRWGISTPMPSAQKVYIDQVTVQVIEQTVGKAPFTVNGGEVFIDTALIGDATITDAMILDLDASKVTVDNLAAISANLGDITAGTLKGPNDRFRIDLANNRLEVYDENNTLRVRLGDLG